MTKTLAHPVRNPMPPLSPEERAELKDSIIRNGQLVDILQSAGPYRPGATIDGFNREEIIRELGLTPKIATIPIADEAEFRSAQIIANLHRRQLSILDRARLGQELIPLEQEAARKRQLAGLPALDGGRSTVLAGAKVGLPRNIIEAVKMVDESGNQEIIDRMNSGELRPNAAVRLVKQSMGIDAKTTLANRVANRMSEKLPKGKFGAIVVAPTLRTQIGRHEKGRFLPKDLEVIDVGNLASAKGIVALITTPMWLNESYRVMDTWLGPDQVFSVMTWALNDTTQNILAERCRFILLGSKGRPPAPTKKSDLIIESRSRATLPTELLALMDEWTSEAGLTMFADAKRSGWDVFNPEID
jgi:hypothetical protein